MDTVLNQLGRGIGQRFVEVGKRVSADAIQMQSNLWWSGLSPAEREKLGPLPGVNNWPQTMDVDPKLDEQHHPLEKGAANFGVQAQ